MSDAVWWCEAHQEWKGQSCELTQEHSDCHSPAVSFELALLNVLGRIETHLWRRSE